MGFSPGERDRRYSRRRARSAGTLGNTEECEVPYSMKKERSGRNVLRSPRDVSLSSKTSPLRSDGQMYESPDFTKTPRVHRGNLFRRNLTYVGKLSRPMGNINFLPFKFDRLKQNNRPPLFRAHLFLGPSVRMFFSEPFFARPTGIGPPPHPFPKYRGRESEYFKMLQALDAVGRPHLFPAEDTPLHRTFQCFNIYHSENRDRGITDKRGPNGEEITIEGPSKDLPSGFILAERRVLP